MKEPILSREEVEALLYGCVTCTEDMNACVNLDWMQAFATAVVEKLCREPAAWMVLECVHLKPCSVTLDREDIEGHRPEHVVSLYALNRSKA